MKKSVKKTPAATDDFPVIMTELVLPQHTNALGTIFGGVVMGWMDIAGAIAAMRYARSPVVTVSMDYLHFIVPIKKGHTVLTRARLTYAGRTSMEVEILVEAENSITGEIHQATHAYLTYVALNDKGKPSPVPPFKPKTAEQKARFAEALKRKEVRLQFAKN